MRRSTPLRRASPLRATTGLRATSPPARRQAKPRTRPSGSRIPDEVVWEVRARSGGWCERCLTLGRRAPAAELHHRVTRARGGPDDAFNLVDLCSECHHVAAHGGNEWPWLVRGSFLRGVYVGPDEGYRARYPEPVP